MKHPVYEYAIAQLTYDEYAYNWHVQSDVLFGNYKTRNEALNQFGNAGWVLRDARRITNESCEYTFIRKIL